jgi:uncharacterized protein YeaO (DUF488 family)
MGTIRLLRAYEAPDGGFRILVDRLWPRGLAKADAEIDDWAKDAAPSTELRVWFNHRAPRFEEFRDRYVHELEEGEAAAGAARLRDLLREHDDVVFVYATRDTEKNHAVVLRDFLEGGA